MPAMETPTQPVGGVPPAEEHRGHRHRKKKHRRSKRWIKKALFGLVVVCAWMVILYFWYSITNDDSMRPPP